MSACSRVLHGVLAAAITSAFALGVSPTEASEHKAKVASPSATTPAAFCAPEIEALPNDVCYLDGSKHEPNKKRTLVIFLHGAIAKNTTWSWNHERMLLKLAKGTNIEVLFPRSPQTDVGYVWPGTRESQEAVEQTLIDQWMEAKRILEKRDNGRAFDEVFVMGFSSGAYFTSSLAMRGRLDVDGYAVFAGGQPMPAPAAPVQRRSPVFVGVCADDETTATHSRAFAGSLSAAGIPRAVSEQHVGHGLSHIHFTSALGYLRNMMKRDPLASR